MTQQIICITHCTEYLNRFQEFVMVLINLQLNIPFQDLAYCGFDIHSLKELVIADGGDGRRLNVSPFFLASQGKTIEDNAYVLSVCIW